MIFIVSWCYGGLAMVIFILFWQGSYPPWWHHTGILYLHCSCRCYMDDYFQFWHSLRTSKILLPGSMVPLDMEVSWNFARCVCCFLFFPVSDFTGFSSIFETTSRNSVFLEVIIGQCGQPQEISIEFYQDLNDHLRPPWWFIVFGDKFRIKKPICCEHLIGGGNSNIFFLFPPYLGKIPILTIYVSKGVKPPTSPHGTRPYGPVDEGVDVKVGPRCGWRGEGRNWSGAFLMLPEIPNGKIEYHNQYIYIYILYMYIVYIYIRIYIYKEVLNEAKRTTKLSWWAG